MEIGDTPWAEPSLPPPVPPDRPPGTIYGHLPAGWNVAAAQRYGADNTPKSILEVGDSISESQAFIEAYQWVADSGISRDEGYVHLPKGLATMAGQESVWGVSVIEDALTTARAETASVMFGTNDARHGVDVDAFAANMATIVDACIAHGTLPILMTPPPIDGVVATVTPYSQAVVSLADARQVPLFDLQRLLIDRGQLAVDLPDGLHPSEAAYRVIDEAWIQLYKQIEFDVFAAARPQAPDPDAVVYAERQTHWVRVFERDFSQSADLDGFTPVSGRWTVSDGALHGETNGPSAAILRLPVRVPGAVKIEVVAASDGAEISLLSNNGGDFEGVDGWYYGHGTNGGARTAVLYHDTSVAQIEGLRPQANTWEHLQAWRTPSLARVGVDGEYVVTYRTHGEIDGAGHDQMGLYTWDGTMHVRQIVVWAPAP